MTMVESLIAAVDDLLSQIGFERRLLSEKSETSLVTVVCLVN